MNNEKSLNELVNDALFHWVAITGVDLNKNSYRINASQQLDDYEIRKATEELNESRELDETGLTTWMMLRGLTETFMKDRSFNAFDLVFKSGPIKVQLQSMYELHSTLENPLVVDLINTFTEKIISTAVRYNFKRMDDLNFLLEDKYDLAWVRKDALLSLNRLNIHQFTQGKGDQLPIGLNENVYEIWNVNSLVRALRTQNIPGITTVLIRDPEALHSFFVFAVKNGDNITILTDKDEEVHPAHKRMSRRPDRELEKRAEKHWFPYQLLDLKSSDDGKHLYAEARTALVPININAVKLAQIGDLSPHQFVWLMLISELIRDKFWKNNYHTPELSYTGEMVSEPHSLVGVESGLIRTGDYQPLILTPLKKEDVTSEKTLNQWQYTPKYFNSWMVERYENQVPENVLNVIGENNVRQIEESHGIIQEKESWHDYSPTLEHLDTQNFGTKDKIEKDRIWAARVNQMRIVQKLARDEYNETVDELKNWYKQIIFSRGEFFANAAAKGELIGPYAKLNETSFSLDGKIELEYKNLLQHQVQYNFYAAKYKRFHIFFSYDYCGDVSLSLYSKQYGYSCYDLEDKKASITTVFTPNCPESLAFFCGMDIKDLPWQLQHWSNKDLEPYSGNSILNRLDPIDWCLNNPWNKLTFRVGIAFSKRAFNARRKDLGLSHIEIEKPQEYE